MLDLVQCMRMYSSRRLFLFADVARVTVGRMTLITGTGPAARVFVLSRLLSFFLLLCLPRPVTVPSCSRSPVLALSSSHPRSPCSLLRTPTFPQSRWSRPLCTEH